MCGLSGPSVRCTILTTLHRFTRRRPEDGALFALIDLALILIYLCVLLIKSCDMSSVGVGYLRDLEMDRIGRAVCDTYGFGNSPSGVYLFFIFFGLGMVFLQILIGASHLWVAGKALNLTDRNCVKLV